MLTNRLAYGLRRYPVAKQLNAVRPASQIANPSPGGGRINVQYRQVECAPPSDLVVNVDNNDGGNGWIRLQVTVRAAWAPALLE